MNVNLGNIITSARARAILWSVFGLVGIGLGAVQVAYGYLIVEGAVSGNPLWLGVALAVYSFLGGAGFGIAKANTPSPALSPTSLDV